MRKKIYCSRCKTTDGNLFIYSRGTKGDKQYYMCRKCNTERCKEYRKTPQGKLNVRNAVYRSVKKNYGKQLARLRLNYHVRVGNIKKPTNCSQCKRCVKVEAHHEDYLKPLEVIWACRSCHVELDKALVKC